MNGAQGRTFVWLPQSIEGFFRRFYAVFLIAALAIVATALLWADLKKAFWFDELFTLALARLPLPSLWNALSSGTDNNPPLLYQPVKVLLQLIPQPELAIRLPSAFALALTGWCLYCIARRYMSRPFAAAAGFVPLLTFFSEYVDEGRPYALTVSFVALSLLLWLKATTTDKRALYLVALAVAIALALSSHFSATLLVASLLAGETVRTFVRRRIDVPVVASIAVGCLPLLFFLPIIRSLKVVLAQNAFWAIPTLRSVMADTAEAISPSRAWLAILACAALLRSPSPAPDSRERMGAHELVAWLVLFCAPIEGYIQSKFSGAFTIRYALVMVLPFSLALALACDRLSRGSATAATAMLAICTFVGVRSLRQSVAEHPNPFVSFQHNLADRLPANQTLVVGTPLLFLPFHHYAPEPLRSRLLYLTDPELALQRSGTNTPDVNLEHLARFERIPIARYRSLIETRRPFLLLMKENDHFTWLGKQLVQDAIPLRKLACAPVVGCLYQAGTS